MKNYVRSSSPISIQVLILVALTRKLSGDRDKITLRVWAYLFRDFNRNSGCPISVSVLRAPFLPAKNMPKVPTKQTVKQKSGNLFVMKHAERRVIVTRPKSYAVKPIVCLTLT